MSDLESTIQTNAEGPAKASNDAGMVEQHSLPDQIAADKYLAGKSAATGKRVGIRLHRMVAGGAE